MGAFCVDWVLVVSPTHVWELRNLPVVGMESDDICVAKGMTGIASGVRVGINLVNEASVKQARMLPTFVLRDVDVLKAVLKQYAQEL